MTIARLQAMMDRLSRERSYRMRIGRNPDEFAAGATLLPGEVGVVMAASGRLLCDPNLIGWREERPCPCCED